MPNPFIILEAHDSVAPKEFIIQHAKSLRKAGYTKCLLEIDSELSPELVKLHYNLILKNPNPIYFHAASKAFLDMLTALEQNNILYEFIDPQRLEEAHQRGQQLVDAFAHNDRQLLVQWKAKQEQEDIHRDTIMSTAIFNQSKTHQEGVIFLGGYSHTNLVNKLEFNQPNFCRYALFVNSSKDNAIPKGTILSKMANEQFRAQFYQTHVSYFDMAKQLSFEIVAAECKLIDYKPCEEPIVGSYLSRATQQEYHFTKNNDSVVTATTTLEQSTADETISKIKHAFPGLRFFTELKGTQTLLSIPGINLSENATCLKEGFVKAGVMKL